MVLLTVSVGKILIRSCRVLSHVSLFSFLLGLLLQSRATMLIQRSSCGLKIPPQEVLAFRKFYGSCGFNFWPQRSSCGLQDPSASDPQEAARSSRLADAKRSSCACIIFGLYCILHDSKILFVTLSKHIKCLFKEILENWHTCCYITYKELLPLIC